MAESGSYTLEELLAATISRDLRNGERGYTGMATGGRTGVAIVGIPVAAMALAKLTHAPDLTIFYTGYIVNPVLSEIRALYESGPSLATVRCEARLSTSDVFSLVSRGEIDFGFGSAAQIDRYGNVNTNQLGDIDKPSLRLLGAVLVPEHFALFGREYVMFLDHSPRKFVRKVDFVTGVGYLDGSDARARCGLRTGGPRWVVTDLGIFDFDEATRRMRVKSLHPGVTIELVRERTGFELIEPARIMETVPPTAEELHLLRTVVDPNGVLLGRDLGATP